MNGSLIWLSVSLALAVSVLPGTVRAEIPKQSQAELLESASHAFTGVAQHVYSRTEKKGGFEFTHSVVELHVTRVAKGADLAAGDRIYVRCWTKKWVGRGNPPPDHYGHWNIPQAAATVEVYVTGDRKSGFDVLSPNGFFQVIKSETDEAKRDP